MGNLGEQFRRIINSIISKPFNKIVSVCCKQPLQRPSQCQNKQTAVFVSLALFGVHNESVPLATLRSFKGTSMSFLHAQCGIVLDKQFQDWAKDWVHGQRFKPCGTWVWIGCSVFQSAMHRHLDYLEGDHFQRCHLEP